MPECNCAICKNDKIAEQATRIAKLETDLTRACSMLREVRMYALGSDVSTRNLIQRADALLAELSA